jgi:hypothetical protein
VLARHAPALLAAVLAVSYCAAQSANDAPVRADAFVVQEAAPAAGQAGASVADIRSTPLVSSALEAAAAATPNLGFSAAGPSSFGSILELRGVSNTPYFSEPAVTVYVGDIPLAGGFTNPAGLAGASSVMTFEGPRADLFGRAGDAGVLVITEETGGNEVGLGAGNFGLRSASASASASSASGLSASASLGAASRQGYVFNSQIGRSVDDLREADGHFQMSVKPGKSTDVVAEVFVDRHRDGAAPLVPLGGPLFVVERAKEGATDSSLVGAAVRADAKVGAGTLSSVTSFTAWELDPYQDWLVIPPALESVLTERQRAWNEEVRLAGAGGWSVGAWLSDARVDGATDRTIAGVVPFEQSQYQYTRGEAAFLAHAVLFDKGGFSLVAGLRLQEVAKAYRQAEEAPTPGRQYQQDRHDGAFLPRLAASYALSKAATFDASASLGTRPGGFSGYTDNPAYIPFVAEHIAAIESGFSYGEPDGRLKIRAQAFLYEIANLQIERSFSAADYFVATAPGARSLGAEASASWKLARGLVLTAGAGLTDAELTQFRDPLTGASRAGKRVPYSPPFTAYLQLAYRRPSGWFASGSVSARGRTFYTEDENPRFAQGAYAVLGARAGFGSGGWEVSAYVANAADKGYYSLIIPGVSSAAPGDPRTFGAEVRRTF